MFRQKTGRYQLNLTPHMIQSIKSDNNKKNANRKNSETF